ncbi:MAG: YfcE family phosphodiesterase [archaeon]|nr:YfcE family phosphodiesterase [archaeon]
MRVYAISDVHGELDNIKVLIDRLKREKPDYVIYLGDDYKDTDDIEKEGFRLIRIPGVFEEIYKSLEIPNRLLLKIYGLYTLITHTEESHENDLEIDIKPEELVQNKVINLLLHGHTHIPRIEELNDVIFVNPGHLKKRDKRGYPPTYAVLEFSEEKLMAKIIKLEDGEEFLTKEFGLKS